MVYSSTSGNEMIAEQEFQKKREDWCRRYIKRNSLDENNAKDWVKAAQAFETNTGTDADFSELPTDTGDNKTKFASAYINFHDLPQKDGKSWSTAFRFFEMVMPQMTVTVRKKPQ